MPSTPKFCPCYVAMGFSRWTIEKPGPSAFSNRSFVLSFFFFHSFILLQFIHSFFHFFFFKLIHSFTRSFVHSLMHWNNSVFFLTCFLCLAIKVFLHSFIYSFCDSRLHSFIRSLVSPFKGAQAWDIRLLGFSWLLHHKVSMCGWLRG